MNKRTTTAIAGVLRRKTATRALLSKVEQLSACNRCLQELLPDPIRSHVQVVNLGGGALCIAATSAVWANQMHYMTQELLFRFQALRGMEQVKSIRCTVLPTLFEATKTGVYWEAAKLSAENAEMLLDFSESIVHPPLKQAILFLARHKRTPTC